MFGLIDQKTEKAIDELTRRHGLALATAGELKQLGGLFHWKYLADLHALLMQAIPSSPGIKRELTMRLAWIDKIPLADVKGVPSKTELGDAALFAVERFVSPAGTLSGPPKARAALLQAKVARSGQQQANPFVPVQPMQGSTKREFDLLSKWPTFDLYKSSRSQTPIAEKIDLRGSAQGTLPYGWYIAAPRVSRRPGPMVLPSWSSWWMAAPSDQQLRCNISFGTLLGAFLAGRSPYPGGKLEVGARFACTSYPPAKANAKGWDRICAEIIDLVENSDAPKTIFGASPPRRMVSLRPIQLGFQLQPQSEERAAGFLRIREIGRQVDAQSLRWRIKRLFEALWRRRRMPVLIFDLRIIEGM